jgi:hypothetical protein
MTRRMRPSLRAKILKVCDEKMARAGDGVGLSVYAFFTNKNEDPELLMEAATWWIWEMKLDHFEKAAKTRRLVSGASTSAGPRSAE